MKERERKRREERRCLKERNILLVWLYTLPCEIAGLATDCALIYERLSVQNKLQRKFFI